MISDNNNFQQLVNRAMQTEGLRAIRPIVEKELLHYDILFCLEKEGLLDSLVFQGGTSLRLCHGSNRFSEDLDFAGGSDFSGRHLQDMKSCIEDYISARYQLEVSVKEPSSLREEPRYKEINVDRWQVSIVTSPERKDVPKQRIKLEIASVPAYTREPRPVYRNYDFLPDGYEDILINTETLDEVMADKLVSLPATQKYIRHRDIWDLAWLSKHGAELRTELVRDKLQDYHIEDFEEMLTSRIHSLPGIIYGERFHAEMRRFLPADVFEKNMGNKKFSEFLDITLKDLLTGLNNTLYHSPNDSLGFSM